MTSIENACKSVRELTGELLFYTDPVESPGSAKRQPTKEYFKTCTTILCNSGRSHIRTATATANIRAGVVIEWRNFSSIRLK